MKDRENRQTSTLEEWRALRENTEDGRRARSKFLDFLRTSSFERYFTEEYLEKAVSVVRANNAVGLESAKDSRQYGQIQGFLEGMLRAQRDARALAMANDLAARRNARTLRAILKFIRRKPHASASAVMRAASIRRPQLEAALTLLLELRLIGAIDAGVDGQACNVFVTSGLGDCVEEKLNAIA